VNVMAMARAGLHGAMARTWRVGGVRGLAAPAKGGAGKGGAAGAKGGGAKGAAKGPAAKTGGGVKKGPKQVEWTPVMDGLDMSKPHVFLKQQKLGWMFRPRRVGLVTIKAGMIPLFDAYGARVACTVLKVEDAFVTHVRTLQSDGFNAVQVGGGDVKDKHQPKPLQGHCARAGVPQRKYFAEWRVAEQGLLPLGQRLTARHFVPGQFVDVQGTTIGKGFAGGMKRWGFKGQPASHGVSVSHRSGGSHGSSQDPGRTLPGKKMAGRMGGKNKTIENLYVARVDADRNLLYLAGHVPGNPGEVVRVRDSWKKSDKLFNGANAELPWPTFVAKEGDTGGVFDAPLPKINVLDRDATFESLGASKAAAPQKKQAA
jgi:large subunit ribosomal protein L3